MNDALLSTHLSWQGVVVLGLLFLSILLSCLIKSLPKDLIFTFAALSNAFFGIISSLELYKAVINQAILMALGLWIIGKAFEQQGLFHSIVAWWIRIKKESLPSRVAFLLQVAFCGAFLHHRYFPKTVLRLMALQSKKAKTDSRILGFPFAYLFLIGGLATAIGTPVNMIFLSLYSIVVPETISHFFIFLPFAILPILLSVFLLVIFQKNLKEIFPKFLEASTCAVVPPDSLLIGKAIAVKALREERSLPTNGNLQSGDLVLLTNSVPNHFLSQLIVFSLSIVHVRWKGWIALILSFAAIAITFFKVAIGSAFLIVGLLLLLANPFAIKKTFREEFPLPLLLEIFSAVIFFFAMRNSGLSHWVASLIQGALPFIFFTICFLVAQIAVYFMPRPLAFSVLFSIALSLFAEQPTQLFLIGVSIAFNVAAPLFGIPKTDEIAISYAISGRSPIGMRVVLILILFASTMIPSCLFWSFQ